MTCTRSMATRVWRRLQHRNPTWKHETAGLSSWKCYEIGKTLLKVRRFWHFSAGLGNVPVKTLSLVGGKQRRCERLKGSRKGVRRKKYGARWHWASGSEGCELQLEKRLLLGKKGVVMHTTTRNGRGKHAFFSSDFYRKRQVHERRMFFSYHYHLSHFGGCEMLAARLMDHVLQMVRPGPILRDPTLR